MRSIGSLVVAPVAAARVAAVCRRSGTRSPSRPTWRTAGSHTSRRKLLRAKCYRGRCGTPGVRGQELMSFVVRAHMSVAGQAGSFQGTTPVRRLEAVLEPVAGAVDGDDVAVVQQPVQDR